MLSLYNVNEENVVKDTFRAIVIFYGLIAIITGESSVHKSYLITLALDVHNIDIVFLSFTIGGICLASYFIANAKRKYSLLIYLLSSIAIYVIIIFTIIIA